MMNNPPLLEVVVTARPSWARVKHLVLAYINLFGISKVRVSLVGPAVSNRYGNITNNLPSELEIYQFPALQESDDLDSVAITCLDGANALVRHWSHKRPDCVLVIADRTETLGVSLSAALMQIPLIHLQGGEVSGSIDDKIRDTNTKLADLHLTTNEYTRQRLLSLGEDAELIKITGCPSIDIVKEVVLNKLQYAIDFSTIPGVGISFDIENIYGIIMFHPDTLNESQTQEWVDLLVKLVDDTNMNWFWFWPNPDHGTNAISKKLRTAREMGALSKVKFVINLEPEKFIKLALNAKILIGNSSFGIRESSFIGLPVINIGKRQFGRQKATNVTDLVDILGFDEFKNLVQIESQKSYPSSELYGDGEAGVKAAKIIGSWKPQIKLRKFKEN